MEITLLREIYDKVSTFHSLKGYTQPTVEATIQVSNLAHILIDMNLYTSYWLERTLEFLEGSLWKDAGMSVQEIVKSRDSVVDVMLVWNIIPKSLVMSAFAFDIGSTKFPGVVNYKEWSFAAATRVAM